MWTQILEGLKQNLVLMVLMLAGFGTLWLKIDKVNDSQREEAIGVTYLEEDVGQLEDRVESLEHKTSKLENRMTIMDLFNGPDGP